MSVPSKKRDNWKVTRTRYVQCNENPDALRGNSSTDKNINDDMIIEIDQK